MKIYNINDTEVKLYYCGSPPLKKFIEDNEIIHISTFVSKRTGKTIWVFILTDKLSSLLTLWTKNRGKRREKVWKKK